MAEDQVDETGFRRPSPLICPKCRSEMAPVRFAGVEVDRCGGCGGLWFDLLEQEDLRAASGSEIVDSGNPETGRRFDQVGLIRCPVDGTPMVRMVEKGQPHLWLESCPLCFGTFFDAGEFRDFREESVRDMVFRRARPRPL
jgi:uncharacterized protein